MRAGLGSGPRRSGPRLRPRRRDSRVVVGGGRRRCLVHIFPWLAGALPWIRIADPHRQLNQDGLRSDYKELSVARPIPAEPQQAATEDFESGWPCARRGPAAAFRPWAEEDASSAHLCRDAPRVCRDARPAADADSLMPRSCSHGQRRWEWCCGRGWREQGDRPRNGRACGVGNLVMGSEYRSKRGKIRLIPCLDNIAPLGAAA